jgi:hypothetical protein
MPHKINNEETTPTITNMKTYGSTNETPASSALKRNEQSVSGTSMVTNESEPLLGVDLLGGESTPTRKPSLPNPFYTDASTIEHDADDPHIGINVFTNDSDTNTLSYSRDLDDSTLGDRYFRGGSRKGSTTQFDDIEEEEDDSKIGMRILKTILPGKGGSSSGQVYFLVCFGLAVGIALCAVAALAYVEYWHHFGVDVLPDPMGNGTDASGTGDGAVSDGSWHGVPFEKVSRDSFGDSVSSILDVELFHPSLLYRENAKKALDEESVAQPFFKFPFPTGAFWTNLVLLPVSSNKQQQAGRRVLAEDKNQYSYPIVAYPYSFQWSPLGKLQASYSAARRTIQSDSIQDAFAPDITFGSVEAITARHVTKFDSLSVSLRFSSISGGKNSGISGYWESYIVQGSPYVTARYYGLTPELTALSDFEDITCPPTMDQLKVKIDGQSTQTTSSSTNSTKRRLTSTTSATGTDTAKMLGICDVSDESTQHNKVITGVQFVVTTKEGLTWLVFASEPITFEFRQDARHAIASKDSFGGVIRVALVPPGSSKDGSVVSNSFDFNYLASSPGVKRLIYHGKFLLIHILFPIHFMASS